MESTMTIKTGGELGTGYMGGYEWKGCNFNGYVRYSDINKIVKKAFNSKFKGCGIDYKVSCSGQSYSMGQSCKGILTVRLSDAICTLDEFKANIDKFYETNHFCFQVCHHLSCWDCDIVNTSYDDQIKILHGKYAKLLLSGTRMTHWDDLEKLILKPAVYEMICALNGLYDSFNYENINGQVDYFDVMFHKDVELKCVEDEKTL